MKPELEIISTDSGESSFQCFRGESSRFDFNWHYHPEYEVTCLLSGSGCRMIGNHTGDYEKYDLALIGPDLPHTWYNPSTLKNRKSQAAIVIHLNENILDSILGLTEMSGIRTMFLSAEAGLLFKRDIGVKAAELMEKIRTSDGPERVSLLIGLLHLMAKSKYQVLDINTGYRVGRRNKTESRLARVHAYISGNYTGDVSLALAAKAAHMNPAAFSRFFKSVMGKTFTGFITEARIHHACQLLLTTDLPVSAAALESGFRTMSHFNRKFLEANHMTPGQYRKKYKPES